METVEARRPLFQHIFFMTQLFHLYYFHNLMHDASSFPDLTRSSAFTDRPFFTCEKVCSTFCWVLLFHRSNESHLGSAKIDRFSKFILIYCYLRPTRLENIHRTSVNGKPICSRRSFIMVLPFTIYAISPAPTGWSNRYLTFGEYIY